MQLQLRILQNCQFVEMTYMRGEECERTRGWNWNKINIEQEGKKERNNTIQISLKKENNNIYLWHFNFTFLLAMSLNSVTNYATAFSGLALLARNAQWAHTYGVEAGNSSQFFGLALIMVAYVERYVPRQNTNRSSYWAFLCFCLRQSGFGAENGMVAMGNLVLGLFHLANAWSGSSKKEKMNGTQRQRMIYGTVSYTHLTLPTKA